MNEKAKKVLIIIVGATAGWMLYNWMKTPKVKVSEEVAPPKPINGVGKTWTRI
ncbi:MAG: hypothetical protein KGZ83_13370 [Sulfuricella sp.]|nr:hypothetical protein [Sulfuricella sp.]